ncbi:hypothetical protein AFLA_013794 [Aspergillus flavus NRRL3357]|nr:hypothetical protein AFLA_013794 [Aspergillus flavus NRRL3357]
MKLNHVNQCTLGAPRTLRDIDSDDTSNGHHATARLVLFIQNDHLIAGIANIHTGISTAICPLEPSFKI